MDNAKDISYSVGDIKYIKINVPIGDYSVTGHFGSLSTIEPAISIWLDAAYKLKPTGTISLAVDFTIGDVEISGRYTTDPSDRDGLNLLKFIHWLTAMFSTRTSVRAIKTNRPAEIHLEQENGTMQIVRDNKYKPGRTVRTWHLASLSWPSRLRLLVAIYGCNWFYTFQDMVGNLHSYQTDENYIVNELIRMSKSNPEQTDSHRQYMDQANAIDALANFYQKKPLWASRLQTYLLRHYARLTLPGTANYVQKAAMRLFEFIDPKDGLAALADVIEEMTNWQHQMSLLKLRLEDKTIKPATKTIGQLEPLLSDATNTVLNSIIGKSNKALNLEVRQ